MLLKQKVMLISREVIVKRPRRDEQTNANSQKPASGCSRLRLVGDNILIARVVSRPARRSEHLRYRMSAMPWSMEVHTEACNTVSALPSTLLSVRLFVSLAR